MRMVGILKARRNGTNIYYRIENKKITQACGLTQDAPAQLMDGVLVVHATIMTIIYLPALITLMQGWLFKGQHIR